MATPNFTIRLEEPLRPLIKSAIRFARSPGGAAQLEAFLAGVQPESDELPRGLDEERFIRLENAVQALQDAMQSTNRDAMQVSQDAMREARQDALQAMQEAVQNMKQDALHVLQAAMQTTSQHAIQAMQDALQSTKQDAMLELEKAIQVARQVARQVMQTARQDAMREEVAALTGIVTPPGLPSDGNATPPSQDDAGGTPADNPGIGLAVEQTDVVVPPGVDIQPPAEPANLLPAPRGTFGEALRAARLAAGYPMIKNLVAVSNVPSSSLSELEAGKRGPSKATLAKLMAVLPELAEWVAK